MKKEESLHRKFDSLAEFHRVFGLPKPLHPMISLIDISRVRIQRHELADSFVLNFYKIAYKTTLCGRARYGQSHYDFGEGGLVCTAPQQVFETPNESVQPGYMLLIHPDFLLSYSLATRINQYGFFSYSANEALHLSEQEKVTILSLFASIDDELTSRIDELSHDVLISQLDLLLHYCQRFYKRQFITRKAVNHDLVTKVEAILDAYFTNEHTVLLGIPTVQYLSERLNLSPSYLSDMLRTITGQNAQQHIHAKLIETAKAKLSTTDLSVSEIAYALGFEHAQSFSRLFKNKTDLSPVAFRQSFN